MLYCSLMQRPAHIVIHNDTTDTMQLRRTALPAQVRPLKSSLSHQLLPKILRSTAYTRPSMLLKVVCIFECRSFRSNVAPGCSQSARAVHTQLDRFVLCRASAVFCFSIPGCVSPALSLTLTPRGLPLPVGACAADHSFALRQWNSRAPSLTQPRIVLFLCASKLAWHSRCGRGSYIGCWRAEVQWLRLEKFVLTLGNAGDAFAPQPAPSPAQKPVRVLLYCAQTMACPNIMAHCGPHFVVVLRLFGQGPGGGASLCRFSACGRGH